MSEARLQIVDDGPLAITGAFEMVDADGARFATGGEPIALCHCGNSRNKPYCDGSHAPAGFKARNRAPNDQS